LVFVQLRLHVDQIREDFLVLELGVERPGDYTR
jgi:hypothetical protein